MTSFVLKNLKLSGSLLKITRFTKLLIQVVFLSTVLFGTLTVSIAIAYIKQESVNLPSLSSLRFYQPPVASNLFADDNSRIGRFAEQDRTLVNLDQIPPTVIQAFISAEDRNFWKHQGVDPVAIARAILTNFHNKNTGKRMIGASTITQQIIKNLLLGDEASFKRKIREALLSLQAERELGKNKILELYLNEIYLGQGAYGVESAAKAYFNKHVKTIDLAEAALLAAMPKGPSNYDPIRHPQAAKARRAYVLQRMFEDHIISAEQQEQANMEALPVPQTHDSGGVADNYFAEEVRRQALLDFGSNGLYRGGLNIHTSMNPGLQKIAEQSLRTGLVDYDRRHGWRGVLGSLIDVKSSTKNFNLQQSNWQQALSQVETPLGAENWKIAVVLQTGRDALIGFQDNSTATLLLENLKWARKLLSNGLGAVPKSAGDIFKVGDLILVEQIKNSNNTDDHYELRQIPLVQGALVAIEVKTGRVLALTGGFSHEISSFDRVTQSKRQPGSAFKPFIYLTAFEQGADPTSPVLDTPIAIDVGKGLPWWRPGADGGTGWGMITMRKALENSRNLASVRLLYDFGLDAVSNTAKKFGLYNQIPNYAAALGALEVTDLQLTNAYAMIANGGYRIQPTFIDSVTNTNNQPIARRQNSILDASNQIASTIPVSQLISVLHGVVKKGTAASALGKIDLPIAGKTGTTNDNVDAWFVGFSPDIAVGVHVGFDQPEPLGRDEMGGRAAAPIFGSFITQAVKIMPLSQKDFTLPAGTHLEKFDSNTGELSKTGVDEIVRN